jgi:hypothetical protein
LPTLYIVDGESSAGSLKGWLPRSKILVWRDALYEGPVPSGLSLVHLSRVRAQYWRVPNEFSKRDRELARFRSFSEVVLWFGSTMVRQLSLIQLLDWFAGQPAKGARAPSVQSSKQPARSVLRAVTQKDPGQTTLNLIDGDYAGWLPPENLAPHLDRRRRLTPAMYRAARKAWKAYTASTPRLLAKAISADKRNQDDFAALPELRPVLLRQAQEYPDAGSGLSRIERRLLEQLAEPTSAAHAVAAVMVGSETYGDTYYFDALRRLVGARNQLLCFDEPFHGDLASHEFRRSRLKLTEFGRKALAREADAVAFNGIDRWIGGVHLQGRFPWRWNGAGLQLVPSS